MTRRDETINAGAGTSDGQSDAVVTLLRWVTPSTQQVTILANYPVLLGRDPDVTTQLDASLVSRKHAVVELVSGEPVVRDLDSKNGVFVNGGRTRTWPLHAGDVLRLGSACAVVETVSADDLGGFGELGPGIFGGAGLCTVVRRAQQASEGKQNLVLQGEMGTGKERFARAVHAWSGRAGAFVAVTGAECANVTHFRAAHQGTLLLDEVLDLSAELQAKLLHLLEQREALPLGETEGASVDVKLVAATQAPLARAVARGAFRADLRARLEGIVIEIPTLRERRADIIPLFFEFAKQHGIPALPELEPELIDRLCLHDWPMNVRELENIARGLSRVYPGSHSFSLEQVAAWLAPEEEFDLRESAERPVRRENGNAPYSPVELAALHAALERHHGNLLKAAAELGITPPKAYRMLESEKPAFR